MTTTTNTTTKAQTFNEVLAAISESGGEVTIGQGEGYRIKAGANGYKNGMVIIVEVEASGARFGVQGTRGQHCANWIQIVVTGAHQYAAGLKAQRMLVTPEQLDRVYYYRPLNSALGAGARLKCAGHGAENPEHRAFYLPYFDRCEDGRGYEPGTVLLQGYHGDQITKEYAAAHKLVP